MLNADTLALPLIDHPVAIRIVAKRGDVIRCDTETRKINSRVECIATVGERHSICIAAAQLQHAFADTRHSRCHLETFILPVIDSLEFQMAVQDSQEFGNCLDVSKGRSQCGNNCSCFPYCRDRVSLFLAYKRNNSMKPKSHRNVENSSLQIVTWLRPAVTVFICGILASCVTRAVGGTATLRSMNYTPCD